MLAAAEALQRSMPLWSLLSIINTLLVIAGCAMFTAVLFRLPVRRTPLPWIACGALALVCGALDPVLLQTGSEGVALVWSAVDLLLPFVSIALLFRGKGLWKAMLTAAGYSFVEDLSFLILLIRYDFDYASRNDALELLVATPVNILFFGAALFLFTRSLKKRNAMLDLTKTGVALYLLVVLTTAVYYPARDRSDDLRNEANGIFAASAQHSSDQRDGHFCADPVFSHEKRIGKL